MSATKNHHHDDIERGQRDASATPTPEGTSRFNDAYPQSEYDIQTEDAFYYGLMVLFVVVWVFVLGKCIIGVINWFERINGVGL